MRIFLTGFMGAGKTSVGKRLAARLGWPFVDLDDEIEKLAGVSVREIFDLAGEGRFREIESRALGETLRQDPVVVATGGGTLTFPRNLAAASAAGLVVWLNPEFATLTRRVGGRGKKDRPLFRDESTVLALYRERLPAYALADLKVDVAANESAEEVAARIGLLVAERTCNT
ncbi:MAG: shikimate kinase [Thermoanaerobaculia bacterium]